MRISIKAKNAIKRSLIDCWAIIVVAIINNIFISGFKVLQFSKLFRKGSIMRIKAGIKNVLTVIDADEYSIWEVFFAYVTMYTIVILVTNTMLIFVLIIYTIDHRLYTIIAFISATLALFWEMLSHASIYLQVTVMYGFICFALYKMYKSLAFRNPGSKVVAETADSMFQFGFVFYGRLLVHFVFLLVKSFYVRLMNFQSQSFSQRILFILLLVYYTYSEIFIVQAFTAQMISRKMYNDSPTFGIDFVPIFFTSSVAAFCKVVFLFTNRIYFMIKAIVGKEAMRKYRIFRLFEDDRCHFLYIVFRRTSYFEGFFGFRNALWGGDIRRHAKQINFKSDVFPVLVVLFIFMKNVLRGYNIIKPYDLAFIIAGYSCTIVEIFNTYAIMKIFVYAKTAQTERSSKKLDYNEKTRVNMDEIRQLRRNKMRMKDFFDYVFFNQKLLDSKATNSYKYFENELSNSSTQKDV